MQPTASDTMHVEWIESTIPPTYVSSFGPPRIAAIGRQTQSAIAVASSAGICILMDIQPKQHQQHVGTTPRALLQQQHASNSRSSKQNRRPRVPSAAAVASILKPKWRLFGNETEERQFRVLAMTWWEGKQQPYYAGGIEEEHITEDLLVAIIECHNGRQYLSCWSPKRYVSVAAHADFD